VWGLLPVGVQKSTAGGGRVGGRGLRFPLKEKNAGQCPGIVGTKKVGAIAGLFLFPATCGVGILIYAETRRFGARRSEPWISTVCWRALRADSNCVMAATSPRDQPRLRGSTRIKIF
jgi:hypothetical protein